ncbi:MAG TPA: twitching motility protein PilT [Candidatus Angelobacter sp.]|nr:twitching motility protein PilT [Candidatus Angelobacter sp.]
MNARSFFDTNILVNADDQRAPAKQSRAIDLVAGHRSDGTGVISLPVLQEYSVTVTRNVDSPLARRKVEILSEFDVVVPGVADLLQRLISTGCMRFLFGMLWFCDRRSKLAVASDCPEDVQEGREIDGLQVVNPFR